jgi:hypothetical protein
MAGNEDDLQADASEIEYIPIPNRIHWAIRIVFENVVIIFRRMHIWGVEVVLSSGMVRVSMGEDQINRFVGKAFHDVRQCAWDGGAWAVVGCWASGCWAGAAASDSVASRTTRIAAAPVGLNFVAGVNQQCPLVARHKVTADKTLIDRPYMDSQFSDFEIILHKFASLINYRTALNCILLQLL